MLEAPPVACLRVCHAVLLRKARLRIELALDGQQHQAAKRQAGSGGAADDEVGVAERLRHLWRRSALMKYRLDSG